MSRSYRKTPMITLQQFDSTVKATKRKAARAVRSADDVPNGAAFRKYFNSWDICDAKWLASKDVKAWRK